LSNVHSLGLAKKFHQPPCAASAGSSNDVMKSPVVGTSQKSPIAMRTRWIGRRPSQRVIFEPVPSSRTTGARSASAVAVVMSSPP
jgi:hypothetical protein